MGAFAGLLEREPEAARLALVEAYGAGPEALARTRRVECAFEAMLAESFSGAPEGNAVPPLLIKGMVVGTVSMVRSRLGNGDERGLRDIGERLAEWVLFFPCEPAVLEELHHPSAPPISDVEPQLTSLSIDADEVPPPADDRALILSAVARLVATGAYSDLTASRIRVAADIDGGGSTLNSPGSMTLFSPRSNRNRQAPLSGPLTSWPPVTPGREAFTARLSVSANRSRRTRLSPDS